MAMLVPAAAGLGSITGTTAAAFAAGAAPVSLAAQIGTGSLLSGLATGFSIFSTIAGGLSESRNLRAQAQTEKFNAKNREIERKKNLVRALALQNVRTGAGGIGTGGSAQAIQLADIRDFELDQATDRAGTKMRVNQLRQNASAATTFSLLSAGGEAFRYGRRVQQRGRA